MVTLYWERYIRRENLRYIPPSGNHNTCYLRLYALQKQERINKA